MRFGFELARVALFAFLTLAVVVIAAGLIAAALGVWGAEPATAMSGLYSLFAGLGGVAGALVGLAVTDIAENTERATFHLSELRREMERARSGKS